MKWINFKKEKPKSDAKFLLAWKLSAKSNRFNYGTFHGMSDSMAEMIFEFYSGYPVVYWTEITEPPEVKE